nr:TolC family outer membrane protein [Thauera sp.]
MKRILAVCIAGIFSGGALAADLMQVYRDALANDAKFSAARAQYEAGQEKVVQGRAGLLPQVGMDANTTWNDAKLKPAGAQPRAGSYNSNGYGVQLTQPLFRWQNWVQFKQGELQTALADTQFGIARQDLVLRVSEAYFNVLNAQDALAAVTQLRTAASEQLELAKTSFEVGTVTITDVHEAQSRFDLASAQEIAAQNQLEVARQSLAQVIGKQPEALAGLREGVALQRPQPEAIADWVAAAETGSFGVQAQQLVREIAAREVERARAGHLPTVDVVARHGVNNYLQLSAGRNEVTSVGLQLSAGRNEVTSVGLQLNVPLFAGGRVSSVSREAAALRMKADADLEDARRSAALAARQSWLGVTSGMAQVKALEAARVSALSALEA